MYPHARPQALNDLHSASTITVPEFSLQLFGFPEKNTTPMMVKAHVEAALQEWTRRRLAQLEAKRDRLERKRRKEKAEDREEAEALERLMSEEFWKVHDVALVYNVKPLFKLKKLLSTQKKVELTRTQKSVAEALQTVPGMEKKMTRKVKKCGKVEVKLDEKLTKLDAKLKKSKKMDTALDKA